MLKTLLAPAAVAFSLAGMIAHPVHADGFTCVDRNEWKELEITRDGVTLNNFSLRSAEPEPSDGSLVAEIAYSIVNRSGEPAVLTTQFLFKDAGGEPILVLTAPQYRVSLDTAQTLTASGATFIRPGTISRLVSACYQVVFVDKLGAK
ncbi:hypothetical protein [Roseibium sp.]|uniref:hypothetical protein n=1 Tax=Roseibium sp. TaxID=1936156 RepID=UPI003B508960